MPASGGPAPAPFSITTGSSPAAMPLRKPTVRSTSGNVGFSGSIPTQ